MLSRSWLLAPLLLLACGSSLPAPSATEHPLGAFEAVPYPPPAALAETVPPRPDTPGVVWIDGEWVYRGNTYVWRRGGWVAPPARSRFAPWRAWYRRDGRLMLAPGTWYDDKRAQVRRPQPLVAASTPPNQLTPEAQSGR